MLRLIFLFLCITGISTTTIVLVITDRLVICNQGVLRSYCLQARILASQQTKISANPKDPPKGPAEDQVIYFDRLIKDIQGFVFVQGVTSKILVEQIKDENAIRDFLALKYVYLATISQITNVSLIVFPQLANCQSSATNITTTTPTNKSADKCQLAREDTVQPLFSTYSVLQTPIFNFTFQAGYSQTVLVKREYTFYKVPYQNYVPEVDNQISYTLLQVLSKVKVQSQLFGIWVVQSIFNISVVPFEVSITPTILYYQYCDSYWAYYKADTPLFAITSSIQNKVRISGRCSLTSNRYQSLVSKVFQAVRSYRLKDNMLVMLNSQNQTLFTLQQKAR